MKLFFVVLASYFLVRYLVTNFVSTLERGYVSPVLASVPIAGIVLALALAAWAISLSKEFNK